MSSTKLIKPRNADGSEHNKNYILSTEESLECPFCFHQIEIQDLSSVYWAKNNQLQLFLKCKKCNNAFIGYTRYNSGDQIFHIDSVSKGNHKTRKFQEEINELSPNFVKIYGEAEFAEQEKLMEICGVGYRKALEFLIKDYLIKKIPGKEEEIKEKFLGKCISELIEDTRIKEIARRATWLGNDETHYFRKWEGKDLGDLKNLINMTLHFISMDINYNKYIEEMEE
ncbi:hypothetical protein K9L16_03030 [Candidatus Pacearchaeota archaeon]|nr:hypothetical protein [Candidatus Pacearchaeota archaeon]